MHPQRSLTGIDHLSLLALDLERTARFYMDVLGLRVVEPVDGGATSSPQRVRLGDDQKAFITVTLSADSQPGELGIGTIHHMALIVASFDALLKWKRWLQHNDIPVYGPYDQQAYYDLIFTDPDGVLVELATRGPGWAETQDVDAVYSPPKESMAPYRDEERISSQTWSHPVTEIESDMPLQGVHHVASITSSLQRTDTFFRESLALQLVRKTIDSDDPEVERWYWGVAGGQPGTLLTAFPIVHPNEGNKAVYGRVGPGIAHHYALDMGEPGALQYWRTSLSATGVEPVVISDETGSQVITLRDPDGGTIELVPGAGPTAPSSGDSAANP